MKIATDYLGKYNFTHTRKRKFEKKKYLKGYALKWIFFLISIISFQTFSNTIFQEVVIQKKQQIFFQKLDALKSFKTLVRSELDTDKDGVLDILDLDDDNDGILDHHEGFQNLHALALKEKGLIITMNGAWVVVPTSVYFELPTDLSHGDEFWIPFMGSQFVKAVRIRFENTDNGIKFIQTAAKHTIGNDPDLDINLNYDFENGGIVAPVAIHDTDEGYGVASIEYEDKIIISDYLTTSGKLWEVSELDTDNDGLIDSRDTDSDNDGCPDSSEAQNNLTATANLTNGSNGGSAENLGIVVNLNGIPLPFGTLNGNEITGQNNTNTAIISEQLTVLPIDNVNANVGDNLSVTITASAMKTATYNIGVPNYSDTYGTDTSNLISYKWYREDNLNKIISTSKSLIINNVTIENSGNYFVEVKGAGNTCIIQEYVSITIDGVLGGIDNFDKKEDSFKIYPNPTNGNFNLLLVSKRIEQVKISLLDITGKEVFSAPKVLNMGENKIDFLINVKSGIYFLKIVAKKSNYRMTKVVFR